MDVKAALFLLYFILATIECQNPYRQQDLVYHNFWTSSPPFQEVVFQRSPFPSNYQIYHFQPNKEPQRVNQKNGQAQGTDVQYYPSTDRVSAFNNKPSQHKPNQKTQQSGSLSYDLQEHSPQNPSNTNRNKPNEQKHPSSYANQQTNDANKHNSQNKYGQNNQNSNFNGADLDAQTKHENYKPVTDFAWKLFQNANDAKVQNVVINPLSAQYLLSYLGFAAEGLTKREISNVISYDSPSTLQTITRKMLSQSKNDRELQMLAALFLSKNVRLNNKFQSILQNNMDVIPTDFSNQDSFNQVYSSWISEKTKGAFTNVRAVFDPATKMIMSSAVYFKGNWLFKLNPGGTRDFYSSPSQKIPVNMMSLIKKLPYGEIDNARWLQLPYKGDDFMVIILPNENQSINNFIQQLKIDGLMESMSKNTYANVTLALPKFKIESKSSLIEPLQKMGINRLFSLKAELSNFVNGPEPIAVSKVLQQASLEVNEEGSIATSVTSVGVIALSIQYTVTPNIEFIVNRPFIAMIFDKKQNFPYFIAKVSSPQ